MKFYYALYFYLSVNNSQNLIKRKMKTRKYCCEKRIGPPIVWWMVDFFHNQK